MSSKPIDLFITYQFIKRLATPFKDWQAYKLGIIDENGNVIKPGSTLKTSEEINAWGYFDRLVANLKKLLAKIPGGRTRLASYAAALYLVKESEIPKELDDSELEHLVEVTFREYLSELNIDLYEEDGAPANNVGSGAIAGLGVGPQGEPPVRRKLKMLKRWKDANVDIKVSP